MDWYRLWHTVRMYGCPSGRGRAAYLRNHHILNHVGENCMVMFRKIPLYPKLISLGNNVWIASQVSLITHDAIHQMLKNKYQDATFQENIGCIKIMDNVFVGSNTTILPNVCIGENSIIGAGSLVNKDIPGNGVYAGVPAKFICSFDEFVDKRRDMSKLERKRILSKANNALVNECWKEFNNSRKEGDK